MTSLSVCPSILYGLNVMPLYLSFQNNIEASSKESRKRAFERINIFKQTFKISDDGYVFKGYNILSSLALKEISITY